MKVSHVYLEIVQNVLLKAGYGTANDSVPGWEVRVAFPERRKEYVYVRWRIDGRA